ncbi:class I SAM-dependent methyltransferase [Amycolatopsis endophytica]|uniref:Transferase n=1 Tax=Amycolatopsis endophytica TaxID=860233 RepID=A0A853BAW5_9PSEU|nr:methyltransferase domain-containing protein [Amycolatopsis endophytica]NYI92518.1 hypothetical protein [Amycolatopsis endophytica]
MITCRACGGADGEIVLDLGDQPPCDLFPPAADPGPDPVWPLRMWMCARCALAQLAEDPGTVEEPAGVEPKALTDQAADAVARLARAGIVRAGATVAEFGSPHGGSWLPLLRAAGMRDAGDAPADVVIDSFGLMHEADQRAAMARRADRLAPGGVLLMQFHSLASIVRQGQWNALRHGHFAYYSTPAAITLAASAGLRPGRSWTFDLYGGTVLLELGRELSADGATTELAAAERSAGAGSIPVVAGLGRLVEAGCDRVRARLREHAGERVVGYGAASRAVVLLRRAGIDIDLLPEIVDISPAKRGRRMPGTRIPVVGPEALTHPIPRAVLLFVPDLETEVRAAFPQLDGEHCEWITG